MGICYKGLTLKEAIDEKESLFEKTGYAYGLKNLELVEQDPAKFMRFQMRLVAACINVREMAKLISANPASLVQGELLFLLANPEGDVTSTSYGLAGHLQSFPYIIRSIADLGFEEDPGIDVGDIFETNDALYGAPHNADNYTWVPIHYKGELIGWTVGLNHIVDVGGLQPGGLGTISPNVFTDGFTYPPTKTGTNFKQPRWWELHWKRRTRTEAFNVLDDKMRVAGCVALHDRILEIVEEFGIDYYRKALREIIERERRVLINRIKSQAVPGIYHWLQFTRVSYKDVVGKLFAASNRDWVLHKPGEFHIKSDGSLFMDLEGLSSEGGFHCNGYPAGVRMLTSLGAWPMFAYTSTLNSALMYVEKWNLPPGSMFNPQNPFAATVMSLGEIGGYINMFHNCLSLAFFARGFLEETFPQDGTGVGYGLAGVLKDGFQWAGGDMTLITCWSQGATPYHDGFPAACCQPNPQPDMGETEMGEFLQPTNLNIGRKLVHDYCGHGKYRGGLGIGMCQMIVEPGQSLIMAVFAGAAGMGRGAIGMSGGYDGDQDLIVFCHDTNMRQILKEGGTYPTDFTQLREWLKQGKLKAGSVERYTSSSPNVPCKDGDLVAMASGARCGWGDVLERDLDRVQEDLHYDWVTPRTARVIYGVVTDDEGKVNVGESEKLRKQMRDTRRQRSVDAKDWWKEERQRVLKKEWREDLRNMFADALKYGKFRREFTGMWQLPDDYAL
jgi:acetone carboxylase alpha subunit